MNITTQLVAGSEAVRILEGLRVEYRSTGNYPFMIGDAEDWERARESMQLEQRGFEEIIRSSYDVDILAWLAERRKEAAEYDFSDEEAIGEWPDEDQGSMSLTIHTHLSTGEYKAEVLIGTVALEQPWHLPAALNYGAWNDCPSPEVHCAFHRHWFERFGAEICGMSGDVVECIVARPPTEQAPAMNLAWEQYWYCQDIVDQGCESISNLGATLLDSPYWYFWWD
jgi:hypothetical protein